jgi:hypothetical protein
VAGVEGDVHHASASRFRSLFAAAGLTKVTQAVHRGPAPFLLNEAVAAPARTAVRAPHFAVKPTVEDARKAG